MSLLTTSVHGAAQLYSNVRNAWMTGIKGARLDDPPRFMSAHARHEHYWQPDQWNTKEQIGLFTKVSWVQQAVNLVASSAAITPIEVKQRTADKLESVENHDFERLLFRPNEQQSRHEFIYATMSWYLITGNCYWWLNRPNKNAPPSEIWIIPSHMIRPVPDGRFFVRGYLYDAGDGIEIPIDSDEICHFQYFNPGNMFIGMSPLECIYHTAVMDHESVKYGKNFYAKDNAKPTGALTFAAPIDTHKWESMKQEVRDEYGGTSRKLMMLNGIGQGAVNFVPMMLSQTDMQFLESREFSEKEITNVIAPGGYSMLSSSSNVATSQTGKDAFYGIGVYPRLDVMAQKITHDLMPMYGDNFIAEFEDVRQRDIKLELEQITTYSSAHTIDEVRAEWYDNEPIGDERGEMLVAQIGQGNAAEEDDEEADPEAPPEEKEPESVEENLRAIIAPLIDEVKALKAAQQPVAPPTATVTINQTPGIEAEYHVAGTEPDEQITGPTQAALDLTLWHKKAKNKAKKSANAVVSFESEHLPAAVKAFVPLSLEHGDIEHTFAAAKLLLQLDPDDDEAEQKRRMGIEGLAADKIEKALDKQRKDVVAAAKDGQVANIPQDGTVRDALRAALIDSVDLGVAVAVEQLDGIGFGFDWTLANSEAREWANQYAGELIAGINNTTQKQVQQSVSEWINNGEPLSELVKELATTFGRNRAELIASTEVTKAYARGSQQGYIESGVVDAMEIRTAQDELVCPTCGPKNGTQVPVDASPDEIPAFHPKCRCWVAPVVN